MFTKKSVLGVLVLLSLITNASAAPVSVSGAGASAPVTVTADPVILDMTVPTSALMHVDADGVVTVGDGGRIVNNGVAPIKLLSAIVTPKSGWVLAEYGASTMKAGEQKFALRMNGVACDSATGFIDVSTFSEIPGGGSMSITWEAEVPVQKTAITTVDVAGVVYTTGFPEIANIPMTGIKVTGLRDSGRLAVGETATLTAQKLPAGTTNPEGIRWDVQGIIDYTVNGSQLTMTGTQAGEAVVTATCGAYTYSIQVYTIYSVSELTITGPSRLPIDSTCTLTANTVAPANYEPAITWSSSDINIATVNSYGVVYPRRPGTVTIAATADGVQSTHDIEVYDDLRPIIDARGARYAGESVEVRVSDFYAGIIGVNDTEFQCNYDGTCTRVRESKRSVLTTTMPQRVGAGEWTFTVCTDDACNLPVWAVNNGETRTMSLPFAALPPANIVFTSNKTITYVLNKDYPMGVDITGGSYSEFTGPISYVSGSDNVVFLGKYSGTLTSRTFSNSVVSVSGPGFQPTHIPRGAFGNRTMLKSIRIPGTCKQINPRAFEGCTSLHIELPDTLPVMWKDSISDCAAITWRGATYTSFDDFYEAALNSRYAFG